MNFPAIKITYSHIESAKNCADVNSKILEDPVSAINSPEWRYGHSYFMDKDMPAPSDIFLTVTSGTPSWTPPATEHVCTTCSAPCKCLPCTWSAVDTECQSNFRLSQIGSDHLIEKSRWPVVASKFGTTPQPLYGNLHWKPFQGYLMIFTKVY